MHNDTEKEAYKAIQKAKNQSRNSPSTTPENRTTPQDLSANENREVTPPIHDTPTVEKNKVSGSSPILNFNQNKDLDEENSSLLSEDYEISAGDSTSAALSFESFALSSLSSYASFSSNDGDKFDHSDSD